MPVDERLEVAVVAGPCDTDEVGGLLELLGCLLDRGGFTVADASSGGPEPEQCRLVGDGRTVELAAADEGRRELQRSGYGDRFIGGLGVARRRCRRVDGRLRRVVRGGFGGSGIAGRRLGRRRGDDRSGVGVGSVGTPTRRCCQTQRHQRSGEPERARRSSHADERSQPGRVRRCTPQDVFGTFS